MTRSSIPDAAMEGFLGGRRIAVAGASRSGDAVGNVVYRKLRSAGYDVVAVHPAAETLEGDPCHRTLADVPGEPIDGVFVATPPEVSARLVRECAELGIRRVWIHRSFGQGSVSEEAVRIGREQGLEVIAGACPMMVLEPVDVAHRCMRWLLRVTGGLPRVPSGLSAEHPERMAPPQ